jgi:hypothetical protein
MKKATPEMQAELEAIAARAGGMLSPHAVVEAAEPEDSVLHEWFEWDDGAAATAWRIEQARDLIQVSVTVIEGPKREAVEVRTYVSLPSDRKSGGYRVMVSVLQDGEQRAEMLADALRELKRLRARYALLTELSEVFAAVDALEKSA